MHSVHYWKVNLINFGSDKRLFIYCIQLVSYNNSHHLSNFWSALSTNKFKSYSMICIFCGRANVCIFKSWQCTLCVCVCARLHVLCVCVHQATCRDVRYDDAYLWVLFSLTRPQYLTGEWDTYPIPSRPSQTEYLAALLGKSQAAEQSQIRNNFWW